ncbi:NAD(P)/FAD-dependent oxidoreductase [Hankyongella ginsenosidimutans]|uniref:NAD(P)/FAD-dependent oxidoreductase n=1 Tax=Hankyongella ginsenosidimutans TaxID=1763828 RepID=UPI001CA32E84|nr:FAD-binding oxidoreductase [Hankyongella ginsenosidimutans]
MYYISTAGEGLNSPPLQGETVADAVVIGGGLTGISAAYHLARAGADVVVLEAETVGAGASGRNGGQLIPGLRLDWEQAARDWGWRARRPCTGWGWTRAIWSGRWPRIAI